MYTLQIYASGVDLQIPLRHYATTPDWNTLDQFRQHRVCQLSPKSLEKVLRNATASKCGCSAWESNCEMVFNSGNLFAPDQQAEISVHDWSSDKRPTFAIDLAQYNHSEMFVATEDH